MSDTGLIVLIIAVAVVVVLYIFRNQLSRFFIKANQEGITAELETREPSAKSTEKAGVRISRSRQFGKGNILEVQRDDVVIEDPLQVGKVQKISVTSDPTTDHKNQSATNRTAENSQPSTE